MKIYAYFLLLLGLLTNISCVSGNDPFYEGVKVATTPGNAGVFINGKYYGNTPLNLEKSTGTYKLAVRRTGYLEFNTTIYIPKNDLVDLKTITLTKNDSVKIYGPMTVGLKINGDTSEICAISISKGAAVALDDPTADFYVSYNKTTKIFEFMSLSNYKSSARVSKFYKSGETNWTAAYQAPKFGSGWSNSLSNIKSNVFYVFDSDLHYSMFQVEEDTDPATGNIIIKWAYNKRANDINF